MSTDAQLLVLRLRPHWGIATGHAQVAEAPGAPDSALPRATSAGAWIALVADERDATMPFPEDLPQMLGIAPPRALSFQFDDSLGAGTLAALAEIRGGTASVLVLVPVSRDPIDEVSDTLRAIGTAANGRGATLVLCGARDRLALWKRKLDTWATGLSAEYIPKP
jgi:hypothetical protein